MFAQRSRFRFVSVALAVQWTASTAWASLIPMDQVGPRPIAVDEKAYAHVIRVSADDAKNPTVSAALASIKDASAKNRYAILVGAGSYNESSIAMKAYVDLYGGFAGGNWKKRDVYQNASILNAGRKGPVVIGADNARLDGFVITGGEQMAHGGGIVCDGVSPTIVNNVVVANHTREPGLMREGLGKQILSEGAGIALLNGSQAYVANNLICENSTDAGQGAGITARGQVKGKILRNVFCNNIAGVKDSTQFHDKVGSRSSPGAGVACSAESSPQISFNVFVLGQAVYNNDAGGIWVEGNSTPPINYNWLVGNLAEDDGGAIYVMGNCYYDEALERHDLAPDSPVSIEGNLIAGNNNVRGGPSGIRVSRWGRADIRRNRIVANLKGGAYGAEGGVICVMEDNIVADNDEKISPPFRLGGDITERKFDERRYVTEITTGKDLGKEDLSGDVVRIGAQWSVLKANTPNSLIIWGKVTDSAAKFEILERYEGKK